MPDTDVLFRLKADGPNLNEVRWFISNLTDCHVAAESLNTPMHYTGARIDHAVLDSLLTIPSKAMIGKAMRALMQFQENADDSAKEAIRTWHVLSEAVDMLGTVHFPAKIPTEVRA